MKRIVIVDDGDTQDAHDELTGQFVELDTLIGATVHHIERREEDGRLVWCLEGCEGDGEDEAEEG